jgi:hypothetical protein
MSETESLVETESFIQDIESDTEVIRVEKERNEIISEESSYSAIEHNKFFPVLMENLKHPTKFVTHACLMHRVKSLFEGAEPLVFDERREEVEEGSYSYDEIFNHLVSLAVKEIEAGVSPMTFYDPLFKEWRSINFFHKDMVLKILRESQDLSKN